MNGGHSDRSGQQARHSGPWVTASGHQSAYLSDSDVDLVKRLPVLEGGLRPKSSAARSLTTVRSVVVGRTAVCGPRWQRFAATLAGGSMHSGTPSEVSAAWLEPLEALQNGAQNAEWWAR